MPRPTNKSDFNKRMYAERRWDEWINFREQVRHVLKGKVKDGLIWQAASFNFLPPDPSKHEVALTREIYDIIKGTSFAEIVANLPVVEGEAEPAPKLKAAAKPKAAKKPATKKIIAAEPEPPAEPAPANIQAPPLPTEGANGTGWKIYAKNVVNNADATNLNAIKRDECWAKLIYAIDHDKRCPITETADWIYHHRGTPPELIKPEQVPSPGALYHLRDVQDDLGVRQDFLRTWMVKMIPDKRQMEFEAKRNQGSVKVYDGLDRFDESFEAEHPELEAGDAA